jgi:hypothetical protein
MTTDQFDALMNAIDALIDAKIAENQAYSAPQDFIKWANTAEQTARELLVTDSPTEDSNQ